MYRSIISVSKIAHQIWYDYSFSQQNKTTKDQWGRGLVAKEEGWGVAQKLEKGE